MVKFFFYKNFTNIELLKKITNDFEIDEGYIIIQDYDKENNILKISDKNENNNNTLLYGKIVNFNMTVEDILEKINDIEDCKFKNKNNIEKYTLKTIMAYTINGEVYKVYIIY